ncbi:universal stress protein [Halovenus marina]|uniref:universal stress protein n=1 Tax=Halovenus marina TaxID=3396621 RepID=UPI003F552CF2
MTNQSDLTPLRSRDRSRKILVPFDGSSRSERALNYACAAFPGDDIVTLYVVTRDDNETVSRAWIESPEQFEEWLDARRDKAEQVVFTNARRIADSYDQSISTELAVGELNRGIVDYWNTHDVDFLVTDTQGRGLPHVFEYITGDVTERRPRTPTIPAVLVNEKTELPAEKRSQTDERRILVPFDESARSTNALEFACSLFPDADITALCMHVVWGDQTVLLDSNDARDEQMNELAATAERIAAEHETTVDTVFGQGALDRAVLQLLDGASVDLVIVGTLGKTTLETRLLPGASDRLVRDCPVPVMVVPTPRRR